MPLYEYHCVTCGTRFELLVPMSRSSESAMCPARHRDAPRVVSVFAAHTRAEDGSIAAIDGGGGGCSSCAGGACACSAG